MNLRTPYAIGCTALLACACSQQPAPGVPLLPEPEPVASRPKAADLASAESPDASEGVAGYVARARALLARLVPGADVPALRNQTAALMALGAALVPGLVAQHPHCEAYLDAALEVRALWPSLDLDTIERDYHHDGVLPKIDNAGVCHHMKDLVVHPATVLVLLQSDTPDFAKTRAEIEEVIGHAGFVGR